MYIFIVCLFCPDHLICLLRWLFLGVLPRRGPLSKSGDISCGVVYIKSWYCSCMFLNYVLHKFFEIYWQKCDFLLGKWKKTTLPYFFSENFINHLYENYALLNTNRLLSCQRKAVQILWLLIWLGSIIGSELRCNQWGSVTCNLWSFVSLILFQWHGYRDNYDLLFLLLENM